MERKAVLITGATSYIGNSFQKYVEKLADNNGYRKIYTTAVSVRDKNWENMNFGRYDVVLHTAGIAHSDITRKKEKNIQKEKDLYYKINCDLTVKIAEKAKKDGVEQFIFISSIIVYGNSAPVGKSKVISKNTKPHPSNFYGDSKLQAEIGLRELEDDTFKVVIVRAPMVYGTKCKGNFSLLERAAKIVPVFPKIKNQRSVLHINQLCRYLIAIIDGKYRGVFYPQDKEYMCTSETLKKLGVMNNRNIILIPGLEWLFKILGKGHGKTACIVNKMFGNLVYQKQMEDNIEGEY